MGQTFLIVSGVNLGENGHESKCTNADRIIVSNRLIQAKMHIGI